MGIFQKNMGFTQKTIFLGGFAPKKRDFSE
jgi:hypothetical protein